jgi:hypothetical protein
LNEMLGIRYRDKPMALQDTRQASMWVRNKLKIVERDIYDEGDEGGKNEPPYDVLRSCLWTSSSDTGHSEPLIWTPNAGIKRRRSRPLG